ncbi:MAG: polysaccharide pyruvyl transferase family protein [Oceanicaulis sp.]
MVTPAGVRAGESHRGGSSADGIELAICGAFDMQNFGDLLFPVLARAQLAECVHTVTAFAPTESAPGLGVATPKAASSLLDPDVSVDAVMIGGGYIVHDFDMRALVRLNQSGAGAGDGRLTDCWSKAVDAAARRRVPVIWNAPGVPFPFATKRRAQLQAIYEASDYFSLRDHASAKLFLQEQAGEVRIVPDPVAGIEAVWPKRTLEPHWRRVRGLAGLGPDQPVLAVHVRDRSLRGLGADALAAEIDSFCAETGLFPILAAVGEAHDDALTAHQVASRLSSAHLVLDAPRSLQEIASVFAFARLYVGASLHGYIVATAYGVPGALIAKPPYSKFQGYVEHVGWPEDLCRDWRAGFQRAVSQFNTVALRPLPSHVLKALDVHWAAVRRTLCAAAPFAAERSGYLQQAAATTAAEAAASAAMRGGHFKET